MVEGVLPGRTPGEILLVSYFSRAGHGADRAAGLSLVLATVADLTRTPLEHDVRVVLVDPASAAGGIAPWLELLSQDRRERILAALVVAADGGAGDPVVLPPLPQRVLRSAHGRGDRVLTPGWLVHAVLQSAGAVGVPVRFTAARAPLLHQLVRRSSVGRRDDPAAVLVASGVPAVSLAPLPRRIRPELEARFETWTLLVAATVRRLDALAGRPLPEDQYLVALGRVWIRRDLLWLGLGLWIVLVLRGRPGSWRGSSREERVSRGRSYVPGYAFRGLFLVTTIFVPVQAVVFVFPLGPLALLAARYPGWRSVWRVLALLPILLWGVLFVVARGEGSVGGFDLGPGPVLLLVATLVAFFWLLHRGLGPSAPAPRSSSPRPLASESAPSS